jgi:hypothetical protein
VVSFPSSQLRADADAGLIKSVLLPLARLAVGKRVSGR